MFHLAFFVMVIARDLLEFKSSNDENATEIRNSQTNETFSICEKIDIFM